MRSYDSKKAFGYVKLIRRDFLLKSNSLLCFGALIYHGVKYTDHYPKVFFGCPFRHKKPKSNTTYAKKTYFTKTQNNLGYFI